MEKILGTMILKAHEPAEPEVVLKVKEFVLVFYGAAWDPKSVEVAKALDALLKQINKR